MEILVVLLASKTHLNLKSMASLFTKLTKCWIACKEFLLMWHKKLPSSSIFVFWSLIYHRYLSRDISRGYANLAS